MDTVYRSTQRYTAETFTDEMDVEMVKVTDSSGLVAYIGLPQDFEEQYEPVTA